jgi:hypothetical protein
MAVVKPPLFSIEKPANLLVTLFINILFSLLIVLGQLTSLANT